jgi:transglutaminase-like putative cysteine protease
VSPAVGPVPTPVHPPMSRAAFAVRSACAGLALLLAGAPVGAVVQGRTWWGYAIAVVALVVLVGIAARRAGPIGVAAAQVGALALATTARFTDSGVLGVLPGPAAVAELTALVRDAGTEIRDGLAPVPSTVAMLLLVTGAFGMAAVAVHAIAVAARAPAAAGVLLLAVFAVPAALADDLLPAATLAAAALGFGLLLVSGSGWAGRWRTAGGGVVLTSVAVVLALAAGTAAGGVGTAGRLPDSGTGDGRGGEIGLSPFTALRGQLQRSAPAELFRVTGLPRPTYLRALTLSTYVPDTGWQPSRPGTGVPLTGELPGSDVPGDRATIEIENVDFRDYWLPLYGTPLRVDGLGDDRWAYDPLSGTAYNSRPRQEEGWTQTALLPAPTAAALRATDGVDGVDRAFLSTAGVDSRVAGLAAQVTAGAPTGFDRAVALEQWFAGPDSAFTYDLSTAPGNGDDALVEFLTRGRRGYCEQFASAMAVMLRTVGVPARVAVGFTGGREDGDGRSVGTADAHAWVEAWFAGAGWTTFDPTPLTDGRALVPPYVTEAVGSEPDAAVDGATDEPTAAEAPAPEPAPAPDSPAAPDPAAEPGADPVPPPPAASGPGVLPVLLGVAAAGAVVAAGAGPALWRARLRRRRLAMAAAGGPGSADAAWEELLAASADRGTPSPPSDTVRSAARRLAGAHGLGDEAQQALRTVVGIVEESRYGGVDAAAGALRGPVTVVQAAITAGSPLTLRNRLLPPSLLGRRADVTAGGAAPSRSAPSRSGPSRSGPSRSGPAADRVDDAAAARR